MVYPVDPSIEQRGKNKRAIRGLGITKPVVIVRIDNYLLYPGGSRKISRFTQLLFKLKIKKKDRYIK